MERPWTRRRAAALVETFELSDGGLRDDLALPALDELAARHDVRTVVVSGEVPLGRLERPGRRVKQIGDVMAASRPGSGAEQ